MPQQTPILPAHRHATGAGSSGRPRFHRQKRRPFPSFGSWDRTRGTLPRAPFLNRCVQHLSNWRRARSHPSRAPRRARSGTPRSAWGTPRWAHPRGAAAGGSLPHPYSLPRRAEPAGSSVRSRGGGFPSLPVPLSCPGAPGRQVCPPRRHRPGAPPPPRAGSSSCSAAPPALPPPPAGLRGAAPLPARGRSPTAGAARSLPPGAGRLSRSRSGPRRRRPPAARGRFAPSAGAGLALSPELQGGRPRCKQAAARYINIIYPAVQKPSGRLPFPRRRLPAPPDPADSRSGSPLFTASPG